jgi:hypothetical protein
MTTEQLRIARPVPAALIVALATIAVFSILIGGGSAAIALNDNEPAAPYLALFLGGWFLAAVAYALRRLQLIEWRVNLPSDARIPAVQPATGNQRPATQCSPSC